ncbi:hypothetical protein Tco_1435025 [Tanacetum coccineum]
MTLITLFSNIWEALYLSLVRPSEAYFSFLLLFPFSGVLAKGPVACGWYTEVKGLLDFESFAELWEQSFFELFLVGPPARGLLFDAPLYEGPCRCDRAGRIPPLRPAMTASYSASLLLAVNLNFKA